METVELKYIAPALPKPSREQRVESSLLRLTSASQLVDSPTPVVRSEDLSNQFAAFAFSLNETSLENNRAHHRFEQRNVPQFALERSPARLIQVRACTCACTSSRSQRAPMIVQEAFHCSPSMGAAAVKAGVAGRRSEPLHLVIADARDARSTFSTTLPSIKTSLRDGTQASQVILM